MERQIKQYQSGYTLIEVILALSILVMMFGIMYSLVSGTVSTKVELDNARDTTFLANSVLGRLTRELQLATNSSGSGLMAPCGSAAAPAPAAAGTPSAGPIVRMRGEKDDKGGSASDTLTFLAKGGGQFIPGGGTQSGTVQIEYRVQKDPEAKDDAAVYSLVRDERPLSKDLTSSCKQLIRFPITDNLTGLEFKYYSAKQDAWSDTWGSGKNVGLPDVIQLTVGFKSKDGKVDSYTTAVRLHP